MVDGDNVNLHSKAPILVINWKVAVAGLFLGGAFAALGAWWLITTVLDKIGLQ